MAVPRLRPFKDRFNVLVSCSAGIENLVRQEVISLGIRRAKTVGDRSGKVEVRHMSTRQLYAANVFLRTADRLYVEGPSFKAREFWQLEMAMDRILPELEPWLGREANIRVHCRVDTTSKLYHKQAISERILGRLSREGYTGDMQQEPKDDIDHGADSDSDAEPGPVTASAFRVAHDSTSAQGLEQLLKVTVKRDHVTIYIDSSGIPLYRRGWRKEGGRSPLRSTAAAAILLQSGYWEPEPFDPRGAQSHLLPLQGCAYSRGFAPLLDPFCGGGTIPIEAAMLVAGLPPHEPSSDGSPNRSFAFQRFSNFAPGTWASVVGEYKSRTALAKERLAAHAEAKTIGRAEHDDPSRLLPPIVGSDRDEEIVHAARRNAERAGVGTAVTLTCTSAFQAMDQNAPLPSEGMAWLAAHEERLKPLRSEELPEGAPWQPRLPLLVTNPPWGLRSPGPPGPGAAGRLLLLYRQLGQAMKAQLGGWRFALLFKDLGEGPRTH